MLVPTRHANTPDYRYGFNGKEMDDEIKGEGNSYDYGYRMYDPRIGKFLSVDPLTAEYAALTPYQFASNSPIAGIDRDGLEFEPHWGSTVIPKNREYENELRKNDPEHAEEIIRQHNIDAFLFVGGALAGGSGKVLHGFIDLVMTFGGANVMLGTINDNKTQVNTGFQFIKGGTEMMAFELGGFAISKLAYVAKNINGFRSFRTSNIGVKKQLNGVFSSVNENMSPAAKDYQSFITGREWHESYILNGTKFDGYVNGILLDAKSGYNNFVNKAGEFHSWFKGSQGLVDQARRQLKAANGNRIRWSFENEKVMNATKTLFESEGIEGIELMYVPKK